MTKRDAAIVAAMGAHFEELRKLAASLLPDRSNETEVVAAMSKLLDSLPQAERLRLRRAFQVGK